MCLHQLENHEPVAFGELGIDPVERDQVTFFMSLHVFLSSISQALTFLRRENSHPQICCPSQVSFHPDDSARLIHSGSNGFKV